MITITEAAKIVGLTRRVIQEYESAGVAIKPTKRNKYGYLMYDDICMNRLWQIRFYRELGYDKAKIKTIFESPSYENGAAIDAQIAMLEEKKQEIENLISVAQFMKETGITPQSMQPRSLVPDTGSLFTDVMNKTIQQKQQIMGLNRKLGAELINPNTVGNQQFPDYGLQEKPSCCSACLQQKDHRRYHSTSF